MASGLEVPELEVWLEGREDSIKVRITQSAQVKWDRERALRRWPDMTQAQALWSTYVAWAAATKQGLLEPGMPYEVFEDQIQKVDLISTVDVDPTPPEVDEG